MATEEDMAEEEQPIPTNDGESAAAGAEAPAGPPPFTVNVTVKVSPKRNAALFFSPRAEECTKVPPLVWLPSACPSGAALRSVHRASNAEYRRCNVRGKVPCSVSPMKTRRATTPRTVHRLDLVGANLGTLFGGSRAAVPSIFRHTSLSSPDSREWPTLDEALGCPKASVERVYFLL